jgi:hypothetical protein
VDGLQALYEAIATVPIPAAPPSMSLDGAAVGLGFLDAGLRMNHVRRMTERLTLAQHRITQRTTHVDISLNMLTDIQLEALQNDLALEKQPVASRAHVYWRRPPHGPLSGRRTQVRAGIVLRNGAESSTRMVVVYALAVAAISYAMAAFVTREASPYGAPASHYAHPRFPEAVVGILLLVPGFLYTRLSLPERGTIAGYLRITPRLASYLCIVAMVAPSAAVAAVAPGVITRAAFQISLGLPSLSVVLLLVLGSASPSKAQALARLGAPAWAVGEEAIPPDDIRPDVEFTSTENPTPIRQAADGQPELVSPRELADIARAGYLTVRQPLMQVAFEVHHAADRPGYLFNEVTSAGDSGNHGQRIPVGETLTTSANGLGLVVVTRPGLSTASHQHELLGAPRCDVASHGQSWIFRGNARPNPSFIDESAWRFEGLISIDPDGRQVLAWHSQAIRDVIHQIADLASSEKAPVMSLQAPAQLPVAVSAQAMAAGREESAIGPAASLAVRFAIALHRPDSTTVLRLTDRLSGYCAGHGLGLWIADNRPGSRQGNWFQICHGDPALSRARFGRGSQVPPARHAGRAGQARVHAICHVVAGSVS